ncbi:hypothetical protein [Staphylococcus hyicus]|uniref:Uncharacterized protein n=1 Tax=Staphylococcus hyicus TaxID=1284 RepID=A0ACD5FNJ5_STAHY|nr:hypothetical protein [Staphylococcus hyicus]MDP4462617.1 hypothetical protein [Staphylococcus hyicus]
MKFLIIKPNTDSINRLKNPKLFEEVEVTKINNPKVFIQEKIGTDVISRLVGDYLVWMSNPNENIIDDTGFNYEGGKNLVNSHLSINMLVNEQDFAYGNVIVTSNYKVTSSMFAGLNNQDIANVMNAFSNTDTAIVDQNNKQVVIDKLNDPLLSPNGLSNLELDEPKLPKLEEDANEKTIHTYNDERYEEKVIINRVDNSLVSALEDEDLQEKLKLL